jgi:endonuclease/exonuclease/phosphatase family metal-dependent hydrolase
MTRRLRLATFNLENLDDRPADGPPLEARLAVLRPQLLRLRADVLCVQEVNGRRPKGAPARGLPALDRLLEGTPYASFARTTSRSTGAHGAAGWPAATHNLVILSHLPVLAAEEIRHARVPALDYRPVTADPPAGGPQPLAFDRPILHACLDLGDGKNLHVLNMHLKAPRAAAIPGQKRGSLGWRTTAGWAEGFFVSGLKRAAQALEARLLVDAILDADPAALVAVLGDLNAVDREVPLRLLLAETADTGSEALAPRALVALERSLPQDRRFSIIHRGRRLLLDHILVSRPLFAAFDHLEIHNETLVDEADPDLASKDPTGSHHAPMVAEFEVEAGA